MSCYFRHMKDVLAAAGIEVTREYKKEIDRTIHDLAGVEYKNCPPAWKALKEQIAVDEKLRDRFVKKLKAISKMHLTLNGCVASLLKMFIRLWRAHILRVCCAFSSAGALPLNVTTIFEIAFKKELPRVFSR